MSTRKGKGQSTTFTEAEINAICMLFTALMKSDKHGHLLSSLPVQNVWRKFLGMRNRLQIRIASGDE